MNWTDFILGGVSVMFAFALFTARGRDELEEEFEEEVHETVAINGRRFYQISCQTCRKIKNHREIQPRVYECTRCKRRTDLTSTG
jgi:uncharacterized paraquat-inducible protein A